MNKVSIKDVAKEAGVSITTVSRALNGYMDVSEKTRKHILEVVERLDYAPDLNARSLGGKADTTIALLTSELTPTNESGFVYGLIRVCYRPSPGRGGGVWRGLVTESGGRGRRGRERREWGGGEGKEREKRGIKERIDNNVL